MRSRLAIVFLFVCFLWSVLLVRGAYLQVLPNDRLQNLKKRQFHRSLTLRPQRGVILDRQGRELAVSIQAYSLFADPKLISDLKRTTSRLANVLGIPRHKIHKKLKNRKKRFVWIKRRLDKSTFQKIEKWKNPGLGFVKEPKRVYPGGDSLSQVLGVVGEDGRGLEGLELHYDELLAGEELEVTVQRDARGRPLIGKWQTLDQKVYATDVELTIDSEIQYVFEKELGYVVDRFQADSGVGVVLDANTFEVLSMVSVPTFDANRPFEASTQQRKNRVLTDMFEPGSTMKSFVIAGALSRGLVEPNSRYFCENGKMRIGRRTIRESDSSHKWGDLSVSEIIAVSSNICITKIGFDLTAQVLRDTLLSFGFGKKTGISFPGESRGIVQATPWNRHLLSNVSFGHGVAATALQVATAYASIANGGMLRRPYLVKSLKNSVTGEATNYEPVDVHRVMTEKMASKMRLVLTGVTSPGGTGMSARVEGFPVAGKTGTAQKVDPNGKGYLDGAYISSFAGFVPTHKPKYVIYVAVDNPKRNYYGSVVAAPVFSKVASFAVRKAGLSPIMISSKNLLPKKVLKVASKKRQRLIAAAKEQLKRQRVPDLRKLTVREAAEFARENGINVVFKGEGTVFESSPEVGAKWKKPSQLVLYLKSEN